MTAISMRERILGVASGLFEARGIHASGVDTIIAESGIAKATLYKHFPSKDQLIVAYLRDKSDRFYDWLNARLNKSSQAMDSLLELCNLIEQWIVTVEFHGLPFHIASVEFPDPGHPINQYSVQLAAELQGYLMKFAVDAGVHQPQMLGQQLIILFEGASLVERLSPGSGAAKRAREAAHTLIKAAI